MNLNFYNDFDSNYMVFEAESTVKVGTLVKFIGNEVVAPCGPGDKICGVCINVRNGYASVRLRGYADIEYCGSIDVGCQTLAALTDTSVIADENGREYLVVSKNGNTIGVIL